MNEVIGAPLTEVFRERFGLDEDNVVKAVNRIKWWEWSDDEIRERFDDLYLPVDEFIKKYL